MRTFENAFIYADGKAERRTLSSDGSYNNAWVVADGVAVGERLIVDGLRNLQNGAEVSPVEVVISDTGVVTRADGTTESFGGAPTPEASAPANEG